jgi:hypothetical protein
VWLQGDPLPGQEEDESAQSVGGGVRFTFGDSFSAYLEYAKPIAHDVALEGGRDGRVFFGLTAWR